MRRHHDTERQGTEEGAPALPSAVLWDMDGTLVDSEPYWIAAEYDLVGRFGGTWTEQDAHALVGNPLLVSAAYLRERGGVAMDDHAIVEALMGSVVARVGLDASWRPGARELVAALSAAGVPQGLVTMSWVPLADAVLAHLPAGTFDVVVTGDRVTHGKPHPEPYATALEQLGVQAAWCVAIEDSPTGLASAEAAGVRTLAVPHVVPVGAAPGRVVLESLEGMTPEDLLRAVSEP